MNLPQIFFLLRSYRRFEGGAIKIGVGSGEGFSDHSTVILVSRHITHLPKLIRIERSTHCWYGLDISCLG